MINLPKPALSTQYLFSLTSALKNALLHLENTKVTKVSGVAMLTTYTVATLPDASDYEGGMVYVSDETGGAVIVFSDGISWRRCTDRVVAS